MPSIATLSTSPFSPDSMAVLGFTPSETLLYDFSNSELFYLLVKPLLYLVSITAAMGWFAANPTATIIYNPFLTWNLAFGNQLPEFPQHVSASSTNITASNTFITAADTV